MKRRIALLFVALIAGFIGAVLYLNRGAPKDFRDVTVVVRAVSDHYELPEDETPALLTVVDEAELTDPFLAQADRGDKVLIYRGSSLTIIYRPTIDKIIDIGSVTTQ